MRLSNLFKLEDNLQIILRHLVLVDDHYDLQGWLYIVFSLWILKEEWTSLNYWTTILIELKYYISIEINEANHTSIGFFFSHSAVLKALEYHNWSAAEHILVFRSKGDEVFLSIHYAQVNNERFKLRVLLLLLLLKRLLLKCLQRAKVSCSHFF